LVVHSGHSDGDDHAWVGVGRVPVEALVWTVVVEVTFVLAGHGTGVSLVAHQHLVGTFGPRATPGESSAEF
jgi:hypothetical protein